MSTIHQDIPQRLLKAELNILTRNCADSADTKGRKCGPKAMYQLKLKLRLYVVSKLQSYKLCKYVKYFVNTTNEKVKIFNYVSYIKTSNLSLVHFIFVHRISFVHKVKAKKALKKCFLLYKTYTHIFVIHTNKGMAAIKMNYYQETLLLSLSALVIFWSIYIEKWEVKLEVNEKGTKLD